MEHKADTAKAQAIKAQSYSHTVQESAQEDLQHQRHRLHRMNHNLRQETTLMRDARSDLARIDSKAHRYGIALENVGRVENLAPVTESSQAATATGSSSSGPRSTPT